MSNDAEAAAMSEAAPGAAGGARWHAGGRAGSDRHGRAHRTMFGPPSTPSGRASSWGGAEPLGLFHLGILFRRVARAPRRRSRTGGGNPTRRRDALVRRRGRCYCISWRCSGP
jgi:hypothetical protein